MIAFEAFEVHFYFLLWNFNLKAEFCQYALIIRIGFRVE